MENNISNAVGNKLSNRFEFATSVIKASPAARLTDRAFIVPVAFACAVFYAGWIGKIPFPDALDFVKWVLITFIGAEKLKDAIAAYGALKGGAPDTVNAGTANINHEGQGE